jgi:hypothetical protein
MKKIWIVLTVVAGLCFTPVARAGGYACGGSYTGGGCGVWLGGLGIGLYGGGCGWGLSLGLGLPGLWAGVGFGYCTPICTTPAYVSPGYTVVEGYVDNPPTVPMTAAQMAGHNTRNWTPPPSQGTGPTYYWTAPPSSPSS